jgi:glyoxylase-like metal-dependent hydrolase (beta-lactamase superfamily II)
MSDLPHQGAFVEVADRCWVARSERFDVNVGLVAGARGLLVVDTQASEVAAGLMVEQVRRLGAGDVVAVVNTHVHFDHTFGNAVLAQEYAGAPVYGHETVAEELGDHARQVQEEARRDGHDDIATSRVLPPDHPFSSAKVVDLGDRQVELLHLGRGHTAGDVVVRVGDADLLFAGDLVEESALRSGVPGFGADCFPMEWPATLDLAVSLLTERSVVVPGHGAPVDREFVQEQRSAIGVVAETIRDLATRGVPVADALEATEWPYPAEELRHAVARGYAQLPRSARSLPLL